MVQPDRQPFPDPKMVRNGLKALELAAFSALAIAGMQTGYFVSLGGDGCGDAAIHSTAYQNYGFRFVGILVHFSNCVGPKSLDFNEVSARKSKGQTLRTFGPQI